MTLRVDDVRVIIIPNVRCGILKSDSLTCFNMFQVDIDEFVGDVKFRNSRLNYVEVIFNQGNFCVFVLYLHPSFRHLSRSSCT